MTSKTISDAITNISTEYIEKAADYSVVKKAHKPVWLKWAAMAACLCLMVVWVFNYVSKNPSSSATQYGVLAEVVEVLGNGQYNVKIIGEDENFAIGDIVAINYNYTGGRTEKSSLKTGDNIAITYSTFEKTDTVYEITPGQIEIIPSSIADVAPMVYVNDTLYKQSTTQTSYAELNEEFVYLGEIEIEVINDQSISDGIPNKNFQANHSIVGSKVYQYGDDIVIEINGKYWLYEKYMDERTKP